MTGVILQTEEPCHGAGNIARLYSYKKSVIWDQRKVQLSAQWLRSERVGLFLSVSYTLSPYRVQAKKIYNFQVEWGYLNGQYGCVLCSSAVITQFEICGGHSTLLAFSEHHVYRQQSPPPPQRYGNNDNDNYIVSKCL
jgi:hypothetical protein